MTYLNIIFITLSLICLCICLYITIKLVFLNNKTYKVNLCKRNFPIRPIIFFIVVVCITISLKQNIKENIITDKVNLQINNSESIKYNNIIFKYLEVNEPVSPFIISSPRSDGVICVDWYNWTEDDKDIIGNTYSSPTAMKVSIYNTINAISGGSHDISADLHIPLGEKYSGPWKLNFVVAQEMIGNGSYANIKILSGEEELVPEFTIESITTDEIIHEITLDGIRDLVIHFECHAVDNGFWVGIICE